MSELILCYPYPIQHDSIKTAIHPLPPLPSPTQPNPPAHTIPPPPSCMPALCVAARPSPNQLFFLFFFYFSLSSCPLPLLHISSLFSSFSNPNYDHHKYFPFEIIIKVCTRQVCYFTILSIYILLLIK